MEEKKESKVAYVKTYVDVVVRMRSDGSSLPIKILWDGTEYKVDKVLRITTRPPKYVGAGVTICHTCMVGGQERDLFLEDCPRRWFIEKRVVQF